MKTFREFITEVRRFVTKAEAQAKFDKLPPEEQEKRTLRNSGKDYGGWGTKMKDSLKKQQKERKKNLPPLKKQEVSDHLKRNRLDLSYDERQQLTKDAMSDESARKQKQRKEAQKLSNETGEQHDVDHKIAQANRTKYPERWNKVGPGDTFPNREVIPQSKNLTKNSAGKRTAMTRSTAIRAAIARAKEKGIKRQNQAQAIRNQLVKSRQNGQ
jgi:hypothetical protein